MKLRSIRLQNVKRFQDQEISFYDGLTKKVRNRTVIVGKNGSGKTTILEVIYKVVSLLRDGASGFDDAKDILTSPAGGELKFEFTIDGAEEFNVQTGILAKYDSNADLLLYNIKPMGFANEPQNELPHVIWQTVAAHRVETYIQTAVAGIDDDPKIGNLLYFPTDRVTHFEAKGNLVNERTEYVWTYKYDREQRGWKGSLESYLCWLYFKDLKTKEEKRTESSKFDEFRGIVNQFLEGKRIKTVDMKYRVIVEDDAGKEFGLEFLSSGEKQIVMLIGEIYRHIVKGSLILIDEPELHLHPVWQRIFVEVLTRLCNKYEAQMILTTQSPRIAESVLDSEVISLDDLLEESRS